MKIRGNTVGTTMKRPDFNQTDPKKSDYIKNNPVPTITEADEGKIVVVRGGAYSLEDMPVQEESGGCECDPNLAYTKDQTYSKDEINTMFGSYVTDMANLIGGEALD